MEKEEITIGDSVVVNYVGSAKFGTAITKPYLTNGFFGGPSEKTIGIQFEDGQRTTAPYYMTTKITYTKID